MRTSAQLLSMNDRRVLISGAASGVGKAMALRFAHVMRNELLTRSEQG